MQLIALEMQIQIVFAKFYVFLYRLHKINCFKFKIHKVLEIFLEITELLNTFHNFVEN